MTKRASKITLFNKNHISIIKEINIKNNQNYVNFRELFKNEGYYDHKPYNQIKCKSPLGFYYIKKTPVTKYDKTYGANVFEILLPTEKYVITYLHSFNHNHIGTDLRPWEIFEGEKSMQEHFIMALKDIIDNILNIIQDNKLEIITYKGCPNSATKSFQWLKDLLYIDLFGSTKGIRFQTDSEKILSHGFDLKTSFRK